MTQDEAILIIAYFTLWAIAMLRNREYLLFPKIMQEAGRVPAPQAAHTPISVIITTHEQCNALRHNLPLILEQEYQGEFEVIVVDMNSTDDTHRMIEQMQDLYPHLRLVTVPESARSVSPMRLALTLGMRSSANEWNVLTTAESRPASSHWLQRLAETFEADDNIQIVLGITHLTSLHAWRGMCCRFLQAWQQIIHTTWAKQNGPYRCLGTNLCYRRSLFFSHRGFADHANLLAGATDIMVNQNATPSNTALCLHPEAHMLQKVSSSRRFWNQERLFFMETRHHFRRTFAYRLRYFRHVSLTWFFTFATAGAILVEVLLQHYILLALVALLWVAHYWQRHHHLRQALLATLTPKLSSLTIALSPLLLHLVAIWDAQAWLRWNFSKKQTFEKKPL